jgi:S1-C subfamily serine protease
MKTMNKFFLHFFPVIFIFISCGGSGKNSKKTSKTDASTNAIKNPKPKKPVKPKKPPLTIKDLLKTAVTIKGEWVESDLMFDDKRDWHCSGVIIQHKKGVLKIVTNKHCTGLSSLANSDPMSKPDVKKWKIVVYTHNNRKIKIESISVAKEMDLAVIKTVKGRYKEGRDFIIPPTKGIVSLGNEVLAIGSPVNPKFSGTVTFGKVSAIREKLIQHDAALNPGNSGGPLFIKSSKGDFFLGGINTYKLTNKKLLGVSYEGLSFSISIKEISNVTFITTPITPQGACLLIRGLFNKSCSVK